MSGGFSTSPARTHSARHADAAGRIGAERAEALAPAVRSDWQQSDAQAHFPPDHRARPRCPSSISVKRVEVVADGSGDHQQSGASRGAECWPKWVRPSVAGAFIEKPRRCCQRHDEYQERNDVFQRPPQLCDQYTRISVFGCVIDTGVNPEPERALFRVGCDRSTVSTVTESSRTSSAPVNVRGPVMPNHKKVFLALARKRRFHEFVYRKNHRLGSSMSARQIGGFGALMNRLHLLGLAATAAAGIVLSPSNAWAQG